MKELLEKRSHVKSRKPKITRQDINKKSRLKDKWRKPQGPQSKMRLAKRGKRKMPQTGYGSPKKVKNLSDNGKIIINIHNIKELENIDSKKAIIISKSTGLKKREQIIKIAGEKKIEVLNISKEDVDKKMKDLKEKRTAIEERVKKRMEKAEKKVEKKTEKADKSTESNADKGDELLKDHEVREEEKKAEEKKERDKVLTKKV